jgi:hypothetical protein
LGKKNERVLSSILGVFKLLNMSGRAGKEMAMFQMGLACASPAITKDSTV